MKQLTKKAFTLIELLVVITIIGILATGAVAVYTSQIQKGRDATRLSSLEALKGGIEQVYQDKAAYPNTGLATANTSSIIELLNYVPKLPSDPKSGQKSANSNFDYTYGVAADSNSIVGQIYEVSAALENTGNLTSKAQKDGGQDGYRLELGISTNTLLTALNSATNGASWIGSPSTSLVPGTTACIPGVAGTTTPPAAGAATVNPVACGTTESTITANIQTLIIR